MERPDGASPDLELITGMGHEYLVLHPGGTVEGFLGWLRASFSGDRGGSWPGGPADAVTLSSFHRAKGLEWPVVYLVGLEEGLVPLGRDIEEERRLLYVALTRAERAVHCSWAAYRSFGGRPVPRRPSPWLALIGDAGPSDAASDAGHGRDQLAAQRDRLGLRLRPAAEPEVLTALTEWRRQAAKAAQVPTHVVFHDATLAALAAARPATHQELLAVAGVGPVKASRYGVTLLAVVARHRQTA
jgi:DNA helicase-2/ATP-dependent DNA helicase PcrA